MEEAKDETLSTVVFSFKIVSGIDVYLWRHIFTAILVIVIMSVVVTGRASVNNYSRYVTQFLGDLQRNIEYITTDIETKSRFLLSEDVIQKMLLTEPMDTAYTKVSMDAKNEAVRLTMEQEYIESLSVSDLNGRGFTVGYAPSYVTDYIRWKEQPWHHEVLEQEGMYLWAHAKFSGIRKEESRILFARVINQSVTRKPIGILVVTLNNDYFSKMVKEKVDSLLGDFYIYEEEGTMLFGSQEKDGVVDKYLTEKGPFTETGAVTRWYGKYFITGCRQSALNWNLICKGQMISVWHNQWMTFIIILLVAALVTGGAFYVYHKISYGMTRDLEGLTELMERAEDQDFQEVIVIGKIQEFMQLGESYNRLMGRIHTLLNQVMQEKLNTKQAQLETLQAQINPHFLYNTLDCISWKAMANDQTEIAQMIQSLSQMFRFSLGKGEKEIELAKEVENIRNYLLL